MTHPDPDELDAYFFENEPEEVEKLVQGTEKHKKPLRTKVCNKLKEIGRWIIAIPLFIAVIALLGIILVMKWIAEIIYIILYL